MSIGRPPACRRCRGTGYVYLWSIATDGARLWFCDRSGCKRFWSEGQWRLPSVAQEVALEPELARVASADQRVLQPG